MPVEKNWDTIIPMIPINSTTKSTSMMIILVSAVIEAKMVPIGEGGRAPIGNFAGTTAPEGDYVVYIVYAIIGLAAIIVAVEIALRKMPKNTMRIKNITQGMEDKNIMIDAVAVPEKRFTNKKTVYRLKDRTGDILAVGKKTLMPNRRYKLKATVRRDEDLVYLRI